MCSLGRKPQSPPRIVSGETLPSMLRTSKVVLETANSKGTLRTVYIAWKTVELQKCPNHDALRRQDLRTIQTWTPKTLWLQDLFSTLSYKHLNSPCEGRALQNSQPCWQNPCSKTSKKHFAQSSLHLHVQEVAKDLRCNIFRSPKDVMCAVLNDSIAVPR